MFNRDRKSVEEALGSTKLVPSRFNVISKKNNYLKIYNSYTGVIAKFEKDDKDKAIKVLRSKDLSRNTEDPLIDFMVEKGFLVSAHVDQLKMATAQKVYNLSNNRTLSLILMPNEDCNFRCVYCYEDFIKKEMREEVQNGIVNYVRKNIQKYDSLFISWFGGEPLISFGVIKDLSTKLMDICEKAGVSYNAGITTNGYKLSMEVFEELLSYGVTNFQITLDGLAETHDKYRMGKNGEKTFERIMENLLDIKQSDHENFVIVLRSNINEEITKGFNKYIDLVAGKFVKDNRFLLHFVSVLNLKGDQSGDIHLCDTKALFPYYYYAKDKGFDFNFYKNSMQPGGSECYATDPNSFVIGSDGMVYKCTVAFNNPANHVGDINSDGVMKIDEGRISLWVTGGANEDSACTSCFYRPSCQGNACPLERIEADKTPCPPIKKNIKKYINLVDEDVVYR